MKKISLRSIMFVSYTAVLAVLSTAYMGSNTHLLSFYILPILTCAYYFDIYGGIIAAAVSSVASFYLLCANGNTAEWTTLGVQVITYTVTGVIAGIFQRENNRLNSRLLRISLTDSLTGLYNYRYFRERMAEEIHRADRYGHPAALIIMDVDHFKDYNDKYGHQSGNEALKRISSIITKNMRKSDIAFRYGGEEFCIILPETGRNAEVLAERIRGAVEREFMGEDGVTISAGVSCRMCGTREGDGNFIRRADKALYKAKAEGRNRVCLYEKEIKVS